jgi:hypothetical protein
MIDLNDSKYNTDKITKEQLLTKFSEEEIFKHYVGEFELGQPMKSPIRNGDEVPSFNIFYSKNNGCLLFKDFAGKRGDFVRLVQELYSISSYQKAIEKIAEDMQYNNYPLPVKVPKKELKKMKSGCEISIVVRSWEDRDTLFWSGYYISNSTLITYNVYPISGYFNNNFYIDTPDIAYAYLEFKDNQLTYKIYRPTADKFNKWRNNNPFGVHQGYTQLPRTGKLLVITKSLKDVMSIVENVKIDSIAVQSETCFIKDTVIDEYKQRFDLVLTLFDNDVQGKQQASQYQKLYGLNSIFIPEKYGVKDFSDLIKIVGKYNAKGILNDLIGDEQRRIKESNSRLTL